MSVQSDVGVEVATFPVLNDGPLRDLSAWRVTIPDIVAKPDPDNPKKMICMFHIEVRRVDVLESQFIFCFLHCFPSLALCCES